MDRDSRPAHSTSAIDLHQHGAPDVSSRVLTVTAASMLILGSFLFLAGGRAHPAISAGLGASPGEFFHAFAQEVHQTEAWHSIHLMILLGPLFWAVAAPALMGGLSVRARSGASIAGSLLLLGGVLWAVAFVIDGFGAPVHARAIAEHVSADVRASALTSFEAQALMMSRLGLISWIACGLGMVMLGGLLLTPVLRTRWRVAVGVTGITIGIWPLLAALEGEYAGGPFTSSYWMMNALAVGLWFVALATCGFVSLRSLNHARAEACQV